MTIYTTLNEIRERSPCSGGWAKLLKSLGKTYADDEPLALEHILDSNGLADALWALRGVKGHDKALRLFACQCAHLVLPIFEKQYPEDGRPRKAIEAAEAFALGRIGKAELAKAAADAADAAADAAFAAAFAAAYAAAYAVYAAAYAANTADDACAAAYAAADASRAAYTTYAAYAAADASRAAYAAAYDVDAATRAEIEKLFRRMCRGEGIQS